MTSAPCEVNYSLRGDGQPSFHCEFTQNIYRESFASVIAGRTAGDAQDARAADVRRGVAVEHGCLSCTVHSRASASAFVAVVRTLRGGALTLDVVGAQNRMRDHIECRFSVSVAVGPDLRGQRTGQRDGIAVACGYAHFCRDEGATARAGPFARLAVQLPDLHRAG